MLKLEKLFIQVKKITNFDKLGLRLLRSFTTSNFIKCNNSFINSSLKKDTFQKFVKNEEDDIKEKDVEYMNLNGLVESENNVFSNKFENINESFSNLLEHSNIMHLGNPEGKLVIGEIFEVIDNDVYVDFGWKFHCVCPKPVKNNNDYVRGAKVRLKIKDLELSTRFLGTKKDVTLLEADCILLGLISTPNKI